MNAISQKTKIKNLLTTDCYFMPYAKLKESADILLWQAKEHKKGLDEKQAKADAGEIPPRVGTFVGQPYIGIHEHFLLSAYLLYVFAVEGLINTIGEFTIDDYYKTSGDLPVKEKIYFVMKRIGIAPQGGENPLRTILQGFKTRNEWAHSKPQDISTKEKLYTDRYESNRAFFKDPKTKAELIVTCFNHVEKLQKNVAEFHKMLMESIKLEMLIVAHKDDYRYLIMNGRGGSELKPFKPHSKKSKLTVL